MEFKRTNYKCKRILRSDEYGFAKYIKMVYVHMAIGLFFSGLAAFLTSRSISMMINFTNNKVWVIMLVPLFLLLWLNANIENMSNASARIFYVLFTITNGISLAPVFHLYTRESITSCLFVTSGIFIVMALYGQLTKRDLTSLGSICIMGLFGVIIASVLNIFIMSSTIFFVTSIISVFIFTGLIAYDSQKLKNLYLMKTDNQKTAIIGALALYLDFINLFLDLLRLFGKRK